MGKRYFDRIDRNWYEEDVLRSHLLDFETQDIKNNLPDFVSGLYNIDSQCGNLRLATQGDIEDVVFRLNTCWNYELVSEDKYYMDEYTFLSSKVGDLEKQLEETKSKIKDVQSNISRLEKEKK